MKKLIISFFGTFICLTLLWFLIGYLKFGDNIIHMHFDFYKTISQITSAVDSDFNIFSIVNSFNTIKSSMNIPIEWLENILSGLLTPLYVVANMLVIAIDFLRGILFFVFNPIFA